MKKALVWVAVAVAAIVILVLLMQPGAGGGLIKVDAAGLLDAQKKGAQVLDIRTPGEFQMGHIAGAVLLPPEEVQTTAANWDRDANYVLYCATGERSAVAQSMMQSMGFKNVADFSLGLVGWSGQLEQGATTSNQTIPTSGKPVLIEFYTPT